MINKVAVIGAGVMGAGIAAQISNAGIPVLLLDIVAKGETNRNKIAESAKKRLLKTQPPPLMHPKNAKRISTGNIEDDLPKLADVDWVIEAVIENLDIKQSLYRQLAQVCSANAVISSNTSTLPLILLVKDLPVEFKQRFIITHFFNPPRYMRLLEIVVGAQMRPELLDSIKTFAEQKLGKGCVFCKDTPGFIANRIGMFWIQCALLEAIERGLSVEEADAVMGAPLGIPKTGVFGLLDLVGLDLMPYALKGMKLALSPEDSLNQINQTPDLMLKMIADGYTGRKGKGGFYRLRHEKGQRIKESINLATGEYSVSHRPKLDSVLAAKTDGVKGLLTHEDKTGEFAWNVLSRTLIYAAELIPEIADDIVAVDTAMKLGYNWRYGPFELLDKIGVQWFVEEINEEERAVPPLLKNFQTLYKVTAGKLHFSSLSGDYLPVTRAPGVMLLADIKRNAQPLLENRSASLWDIGDGIACLEFHSKMNTLDMDSIAMVNLSIETVEKQFAGLVIHNDADNFSAGANLGLLVNAIHHQQWQDVVDMINNGQQAYKALKFAPFPVVAAPGGLALGGGCEILLHCDAIQAHAELYAGLVEVGVGLIPGWGGCKEFLLRCFKQPHRFGGPLPPIAKAFQTIGMASVSSSAFDAKALLLLSPDDDISMNKDYLLADAKAKVLTLSRDYTPPEPAELHLPGKTAAIALKLAAKSLLMVGKATEYDVLIGTKLAHVISGGDTDMTEPLTEDDLYALELESFLELVKQPQTLARLEHMLATGKPLRN